MRVFLAERTRPPVWPCVYEPDARFGFRYRPGAVERLPGAYLIKINRYGYWGAAQLWRDGRRSSFLMVLFRPSWRFVRTYGLQLGFLDGTRGLIFCMVQAYGTYAKWSLLWSWQRGAKKSNHVPELPEFDEDDAVWSGLRRLEEERKGRTVEAGV